MVIGIFGGDRRMAWAGRSLLAAGHKVEIWGLEAEGLPREQDAAALLLRSRVALLPLPLLRGGLLNVEGDARFTPEDVLQTLTPDKTVFAGMPDPALAAFCSARGAELIDYSHRPELVIPGAHATAEAALALLIQNTPSVLEGSRLLILGAGRIALRLARLADALGAHVTLAARGAKDRERISALGWGAVSLDSLPTEMENFSAVINTVPAPVLSDAALLSAGKDCLLLELASAPGAFDAAGRLGLDVLRAPGLPGKTAPAAAGQAVADAVQAILLERGMVK